MYAVTYCNSAILRLILDLKYIFFINFIMVNAGVSFYLKFHTFHGKCTVHFLSDFKKICLNLFESFLQKNMLNYVTVPIVRYLSERT